MAKASFFKKLKRALGSKPATKPKNTTKPKPTAQTKTATPSAPEKKEPFVYVTLKGKKFHYDLLCPGIRNSKEIKMALSKARKAGYAACDKCCYSYLHE